MSFRLVLSLERCRRLASSAHIHPGAYSETHHKQQQDAIGHRWPPRHCGTIQICECEGDGYHHAVEHVERVRWAQIVRIEDHSGTHLNQDCRDGYRPGIAEPTRRFPPDQREDQAPHTDDTARSDGKVEPFLMEPEHGADVHWVSCPFVKDCSFDDTLPS